MENVHKLPIQLHEPQQKLELSDDNSARHKILLELGEALVIYLVGILFGEYKRSGLTNMDIEARFYAFSRKKPSFGNFIEFYRLLSRIITDGILSAKFEKNDYPAFSQFDMNWTLLRQIVDQGSDAGFAEKVEERRKGRTPAKKTIQEFFNTLVEVRNIYAHPEDKAGPKDTPRKWPVGDEYFAFINPFMEQALGELIADLDMLTHYRPARPEKIDDVNRSVVFSVEQGGKPDPVTLTVPADQMAGLSSELKYLLDTNDRIYAQLYYHTVPPLNQQVAREVIEREKSKMIEPHLRQMIKDKLADDARIDEMELLVLKDTARSGFISEEKLFAMIDESCAALKLEVRAGTPVQPGDVFIQKAEDQAEHRFNPWWLNYLSLVTKVDRKTVSEEKTKQKAFREKIKELEKSKKELPVLRKIEKETDTINDLRKKRKAAEKELKKAGDADREKLETRLDDVNRQLAEAEAAEKILQETLAEKTAEIDQKISRIQQEFDVMNRYFIWGIHKNLWRELGQYVEALLEKSLNRNAAESGTRWINDPNAWQIGALSYTYWAQIFPETAPLQNIFHIGMAVANPFKWVSDYVDPSLKEILKQPVTLMWTSVDDKRMEKIDPDRILISRRQDINTAIVEKYADQLLRMGTVIKAVPIEHRNNPGDAVDCFIPVQTYLAEKDKFVVGQIYSRLWTIADFITDGELNLSALKQYDREMAWYLQMFANVIGQLNDYALEIGINAEVINQREDQFKRHKEVMFAEFAKLHPAGSEFKAEKTQIDTLRLFARETLGLNDYLFENILSAYRLSLHSKKGKTSDEDDGIDDNATVNNPEL